MWHATGEERYMGQAAVGSGDEQVPIADDQLPEDVIIDLITGDAVKETEKEKVRQELIRGLWREYRIPLADMARDFPVPTLTEEGRRRIRRADIAIFRPGTAHTADNVQRVVICKPRPKNGKVTKIRTHEQARRDLEELEVLMGYDLALQIEYGMWANGVDYFFLHKKQERFGVTYHPMTSWPLVNDSLAGPNSLISAAKLRRGEAGMLKTAFRRCHNYIHGNEGMSKDAAFWQFLYLLFAKVHDEQVSKGDPNARRFYALPEEPYDDEGRRKIRRRVLDLFAEVKQEYPDFTARDEITLSDRALAFIVSELGAYDLDDTEIDVKGLAYQELVGTNLRGDRGQYFTPRGAVQLMVDILDPQADETVFDPACGTGGFLRETLRHRLVSWQVAEDTANRSKTPQQLAAYRSRLRGYAEKHLFGADFDPSLVRATNLNVMLLTGGPGNIYHMDSLAFPVGHLDGLAEARSRIPLNSIDVLMTNPPFGTDIKIVDGDVLNHYRDGVAKSWSRNKETGQLNAADRDAAPPMAPEQLFIQRAVEWVKPGGRIGIVLPNGILSNPGPADEAIRRWILANCWVLASVELPVETFIVEANVNILTTLLFLKKKTAEERMDQTLGVQQDYPVFMAVAEKVGVDRRGNEVYERKPNGDIIYTTYVETEEVLNPDGHTETRVIQRRQKVIDNDLPKIAEAYHAFRCHHPEPGKPR